MLTVQKDWFDVPVASATVLQDREDSDYTRVLFFENMTASTISVTIQKSTDGGTTWSVVGVVFNLGAVGSGTEVAVKTVPAASGIIRVLASGGANDRDVVISMVRYYLDTSKVWTKPIL